MDRLHYEEMFTSLTALEQEGSIQNKELYLFGHCNATEELVDLLLVKGYHPVAILDNNLNKHGKAYKNIPIVPPGEVLSGVQEHKVVCVVAKAYAAMADQLIRLGYSGQMKKLIDFNSYADYSLSDETMAGMKVRVERGREKLAVFSKRHPGYYKVLCPFQALGDIYIMMSYLLYFLEKKHIAQCVIGVIGDACGQVARLYCPDGNAVAPIGGTAVECRVEVCSQKDMDEMIQAALYFHDSHVYIPHQDRPYVVNLFKALYVKLVPLTLIYCCGVFGLPASTVPIVPTGFIEYSHLGQIPAGNAVILSPFAKSVTALPAYIWVQIVDWYKSAGKACYTNVIGDEAPIAGTIAISPKINEMKSVVEHAGIFIGIRSGMCDVVQTAKAEKIALFPDYNYCDTKWKAIDMYALEGWENIVVKEGFEWKRESCYPHCPKHGCLI